jgi:uncharacterized spore protein YtfJ
MGYGEFNVKALLDGLAGSVKDLTDPHRIIHAPIEAQGKTVIPCVSLAFGFGGGGGGGEGKNAFAKIVNVSETGAAGTGSGEGGGAGASAEPKGFLVIGADSVAFVRS